MTSTSQNWQHLIEIETKFYQSEQVYVMYQGLEGLTFQPPFLAAAIMHNPVKLNSANVLAKL